MTSRAPPPVVKPFVRDGVRYGPEPWGAPRAVGDRATYLVAVDVATGDLLWRLPMWTLVDDPAAPPDPGRHFGSIGPGPQAHELLVRDEYGASLIVDLVTRAVRALPVTRRAAAPRPMFPPPPGDIEG